MAEPVSATTPSSGGSALLSVRGVSVRFGGIVALDDVSFDVAPRRHLRPDRPQRRRQDHAVQLHEPAVPVPGRRHPARGPVAHRRADPPHRRRSASGRTFQNLAMFRTLHGHRQRDGRRALRAPSPGFVSSALRLPKVGAEEKRLRERAHEIMDYLGLPPFANRAAGDLPFATQKRVELGRALAADPKLLMLDEPAAGPEPRRARSARRRDPRHPRSLGDHRAAGRAPHEPGDEPVGPHRGAELRPQDRRGHAERRSRTTPT